MMNFQNQARASTTESEDRKDIKIKKGQQAPHDGWLLYDDGYKFLREADERAIYAEADLYECQNNAARSKSNPLLMFAVGSALGIGVALAVKDQNDFYKFAVGAGVGALAIWSFN